MKILHTSDWHIGRSLHGRKRYQEHEAFLDWLAELLQSERVDVLLVAGDVFDSGTPSNRAQELYYRFLARAALSGCRHVVVIAGNHDSPTFLNAPRGLLQPLNIHIVAAPSASPEHEVLLLKAPDNSPELVVCAVPFLRDKDVRSMEAGESAEDKERKTLAGIRQHYEQVFAHARDVIHNTAPGVPMLGMGHLFTSGAKTVEGDGVRDLYVGSLAHIGAEIFPPDLTYLALGHLHMPQSVGGSERMRYSGSPLPMGFGEAAQQKEVCLVDCGPDASTIHRIPVPTFQQLERIRGNWQEIETRVRALVDSGARTWLEILYEGDEVAGSLRPRLDDLTEGSELEILRVRDAALARRTLEAADADESLCELDIHDVFERCLAEHAVPAEQQEELRGAYRELLNDFYSVDRRAQ